MILSVEPNMPPFTTDELLLRRMVDNLVSNAIKYTLPGGTVHIKVTRRGEGIEIAVIDTGIGIDEEEREHLFERFFRSARPEARQERGTGLGLALVQESVRRLGGEISVTSTVDVGSTFTVWLPSLAPVESVPVIPPAGSTSASDA
jgi:signal transduction histidine kinase